MCKNLNDCPKAKSCWRVLAPPEPDDQQIYIKFHNICHNNSHKSDFLYYWHVDVPNQELVVKEDDT